jgi:hypothetical protein
MRLASHIIRSAALLMLAAGCASVNRTSAARLATEGGVVAKTAQNSIGGMRGGLDLYVESEFLNAPLTHRPFPTPAMLGDITRAADALRRREAVFSDLAKTYTAFGNLATYDAGAEVESALGGLTGSINEYAKIVSPASTPISAVAGSILSRGGGLLARRAQERKIRRGSEAIRSRLETFRELLNAEAEIHTSVRARLVAQGGNTTRSLWTMGLVRPDAILQQHVGSFGFTYDSAALNRLQQREPPPARSASAPPRHSLAALQMGLDSVLTLRVRRRMEVEGLVVRETIGGLDELITAHKKLERGVPLNVETLTGHLSAMRTYLDQLREMSDG